MPAVAMYLKLIYVYIHCKGLCFCFVFFYKFDSMQLNFQWSIFIKLLTINNEILNCHFLFIAFFFFFCYWVRAGILLSFKIYCSFLYITSENYLILCFKSEKIVHSSTLPAIFFLLVFIIYQRLLRTILPNIHTFLI